MLKLSEIEEGFAFVNFAPYGEHKAYLSEEAGQVIWESAFMDDLGEEERIENIISSGDWKEIPHRNDIGAGKRLVFKFAGANFTQAECDYVDKLFQFPNAYEHFKQMLREKGLLTAWDVFSRENEIEALHDWLARNRISYEREDGGIVDNSAAGQTR